MAALTYYHAQSQRRRYGRLVPAERVELGCKSRGVAWYREHTCQLKLKLELAKAECGPRRRAESHTIRVNIRESLTAASDACIKCQRDILSEVERKEEGRGAVREERKRAKDQS